MSIDDLLSEELVSVQLDPNPAALETMMTLSVSERTNITINLFNAQGQYLRNIMQQDLLAGNHQFEVDLSDLSSGIYFLRIQTPNE